MQPHREGCCWKVVALDPSGTTFQRFFCIFPLVCFWALLVVLTLGHMHLFLNDTKDFFKFGERLRKSLFTCDCKSWSKGAENSWNCLETQLSSIRIIAEMLNANKDTVRPILYDEINISTCDNTFTKLHSEIKWQIGDHLLWLYGTTHIQKNHNFSQIS